MNLFLQLTKPENIPEDSEVLGKVEHWMDRILRMSWDDILHETIKLGGKLLVVVIIYFVARWAIKKMDGFLKGMLEKRELDPSLNTFIRKVLRITIWTILALIMIGILGIKTTSLFALLASVGFAIGMALSGTLQNFAGGVLILFLKPFRTGDYIETQGEEGTVKAINLFNTVLITPDNKTIILPNGSISSGIINNVTASGTRRIEWTFCISYGDSYDKARSVLTQLLEADSRVMKTPTYLIALGNLADSAVQITVRAWTTADDYWDVYFDMNERVYKIFPEHGLTIPFNQLEVNLTTKQIFDDKNKQA